GFGESSMPVPHKSGYSHVIHFPILFPNFEMILIPI
ncbi:MAG: hypothetical protein ACI8VE_001468, partial [Natrialbaceae archaeon]